MKKIFLLLALLLPSVVMADDASLGLFPFFTMGENIADVWLNPTSQTPAGANGQVVVDGDRFVTSGNGQEIRFWGVNTCFSMNFPEKEDAVRYAKRMASFGINAVRLHHMDSHDIWGKNYPKNVTTIDPDQLDRLDWLIYQFKLNGIYVNINLHVSRRLVDSKEFASAERGPDRDKGLDNFEPRMVELQKKYARDLLTHVNPYTKLAYTDDPCVAMIEINNENSVVASWFWGALDRLGATYEAELQKQWNEWLRKKYASTKELRSAWNCRVVPQGEEIIPDPAFNDPKAFAKSNWNVENGSGSAASVKVEDGIMRLTVTKLGELSWNPQYYFRQFPIQGGIPYTLKFRVRTPRMDAQKLNVSCSQSHSDWQNLGFRTSFDVGKEWNEYSFSFIPLKDDESARISFSGFQPGIYEFDDVSLRAGGEIGISPKESLEDGSIGIVYRFTNSHTTDPARADFTNFLIDVETNYWCEMRRFIKEDLKAKAPVTGTQLNYGAHYAQGRMDYCDIHAYWNHPSFPGKPWDGGNWKLGNTSVANVLGNGSSTITSLANNRVLGKPYTVSEYNHPYPNLYGAEGFPMIASMAGFQHWNGIFIFAWSHAKEFSPKETPSFFDIKGNSVQLVHMAACHNLFVRGDVKDANTIPNPKKIVYSVTESEERTIHANASSGYGRSLASIGFCPENPLQASVGVRLVDLKLTDPDTDSVKPFVKPEEHQSPNRTVSSTGELLWNGEIDHRGFYQVDTPKTKIFTGFIQDRTFSYSDGTKIEFGKTLLDWATVSFTQTRPNHWLLAATGLQKNSECVLGLYADEVKDTPVEEYPNLIDKQITFCQKKGHAPLMCEGIPARITLPAAQGVTVKCYSLDGNAKRTGELPVKRVSDAAVRIEISREYRTLWYEVVFE